VPPQQEGQMQMDVGARGAGVQTAAISVRGVTKRFGSVTAVDEVSLDVSAGEFFALLGPSGSGKTTMLRMIAGFERPTAGTILLDGVDVTNRPPFERDVNTVFQDYALFPHMNVARNVEYGLRVKKVPKAERARRVDEALATVRLGRFGDRKPHELSGGQRQRVALARALVNRPRVLLLDEPLGALDLKLREEMQVELKAIQRDAGITFVFVTHDQGEALSMSDRIAVFEAGRIEQVATPYDLYERPATDFVASFVGTSTIIAGNTAARLFGEHRAYAMRPERLRIVAPDARAVDGEVLFDAVVNAVQYLGYATRIRAELEDGAAVVVDVPHDGRMKLAPPAPGERIRIAIEPNSALQLSSTTVAAPAATPESGP
jgi:putative spermidine/putrescine transport system ATP-binding protein